jgi:hypothetical protein
MSGTLAEVLQQLQEVVGRLDKAAVSAKGAEVDAQRASTLFGKAATGSTYPSGYIARQEAHTAADKAGKVGRLLSEAATAFAEYVSHIAPGTGVARVSASNSMPSGKQLLEPSGSGPLSSTLLGLVEEVPNADDGLEHMHTLADQIQDAVRPGGQAVPRTPEPVAGGSDIQGGHAGDFLLATMTLAIMGIKSAEIIVNLRRKSQLTHDKAQEGDDHG